MPLLKAGLQKPADLTSWEKLGLHQYGTSNDVSGRLRDVWPLARVLSEGIELLLSADPLPEFKGGLQGLQQHHPQGKAVMPWAA